jgi:hypothetical protein
MMKYAREQFFINANDMLDKNGKSNPKSYWKLVKKLMGNCKHSPNIPPLQKFKKPSQSNRRISELRFIKSACLYNHTSR